MSSPPDEVGVALIGYGFAGKIFHAPLLLTTPGLQLRVVGSSQPEAVRADLPTVAVVEATAAAVHPEVELVVIATPNACHAPLAKAALQAGKHVVVDKPFALSLAEAREVVALASACQRLVSVFQNRRWDSDFLAIKAALAQGRVGTVQHFESHIDRWRPHVRGRWREQAEAPGSGLWYDLGPHLVDQALQLFGLPEHVTTQLAIGRLGGQTDDWFHTVLGYADGLRVILHASQLVAGGSARFTVHGQQGSLVKRHADHQEDQLRQGMRPGDDGWGRDPDATLLYKAEEPVQELPTPAGDFGAYYRAIQAAITLGSPNPVTPAQALAVMAVLEAGRDSHHQGQIRPLALTAEERAAWSH